jgi:hypothetical protein
MKFYYKHNFCYSGETVNPGPVRYYTLKEEHFLSYINLNPTERAVGYVYFILLGANSIYHLIVKFLLFNQEHRLLYP